MPYPEWKLTFKLNLPSNQSFSGRVSLSKLALEKSTFQFFSSTLSGSQHMLVLALDGTITKGWAGAFLQEQKDLFGLHIKRQMGNDFCGGCRGHKATRGVCVVALLPGTTCNWDGHMALWIWNMWVSDAEVMPPSVPDFWPGSLGPQKNNKFDDKVTVTWHVSAFVVNYSISRVGQGLVVRGR